MSKICAFDHIENQLTLYCGKDCIKKFFISFREHATNLINFKKKKILLLTKEKEKSHQDAKLCYICRKRFLKTFANDKNCRKVRDHCHYIGKYRGAPHSICNLRFNVPREVPVVFFNGSNYD